MSEQVKVLEMVKACFDDRQMTINGRNYDFTKCNHQKRLKVFGFMMEHKEQLSTQNFGFLGTKEWADIEGTLFSVINYQDAALSKLNDHFSEDKYAEDYLQVILVGMQVICYPFTRGNVSG